MTKTEKVLKIIQRLKKVYPNAQIALNFENPYQLLVATILAAQTNDIVVNKATPALFKKYPKPKDLAVADENEIDSFIKGLNFHHNKARSIKQAAQKIVSDFGGEVPDKMEELDSLPGVARKTANVVLTCAFNKPAGIIIDTHMIRMSQRLGLSEEKDPEKIELDLMEIVPKEHWKDFPLMLILHGRHFCTARPHTCLDCPLEDLCPDMQKS